MLMPPAFFSELLDFSALLGQSGPVGTGGMGITAGGLLGGGLGGGGGLGCGRYRS